MINFAVPSMESRDRMIPKEVDLGQITSLTVVFYLALPGLRQTAQFLSKPPAWSWWWTILGRSEDTHVKIPGQGLGESYLIRSFVTSPLWQLKGSL